MTHRPTGGFGKMQLYLRSLLLPRDEKITKPDFTLVLERVDRVDFYSYLLAS